MVTSVSETAVAPWLRLETQTLVKNLLISHERAFSELLLSRNQITHSKRTAAQELFASPLAVLAHDGGSDPLLTYANSAALRLWGRSWTSMVGMPSRFTAEESARPERASTLKQVRQGEGFRGYSGIRINREGRRFMISNARIWSLWGDIDEIPGQAAAFSSWWWI
jgi:hypothetical protein